MNCSLGVNAFRPGVQVAAHHFSKACSRLLVAAAPTTRCFSSTTLLPSTAQNQWQAKRGRLSSSTPFPGPSSISRIAVRTLKFAARNRVIIHYVDLPPNYKDEEGLPFRVDDLAAGEVLQLFGPQMTTPAANRLLRILHGRRVAGTLDDPVLKVNTAGYTPKDRRIALDYLRKNIYVDEVVNAGLRAEDELAALEKQQEEDAQAQAQAEGEDNVTKQLGYKSRFKMYQDDTEGLDESEQKKPEPRSVYGKSAFDAIRARNEAIWKEKLRKQEEERKKLEEEYKNGKAGPLAKADDTPKREVSAKRKEWEEWAMSDLKEPPKMPAWKRLLPSTVFVALLVAGFLTYSQLYVAPSRENRLWPDCPPAAATVAVLIGANVLIWFLWKVPVMWKPLLRYFLISPATPNAFSMLGAVFSHQVVWGHLIVNMPFLWFFGTRLHDEVGRADFLTTYILSGSVGFLTSLFWLVLKGNFHMTTLGASGAIYGISAAYFWMHRFEGFKIFGLPPDPYTGVQGLAFIGLFGGLNIWGLFSRNHTMDVVSHLGGMLVGIIAGHLMEQKKKARLQGAGNTQLNLKDQKTGSGVLDTMLEKN
ncbi:hypothetical protein NEUTE1DRAFT_91388 [Neurospora tetrasperma FGSC 2508]|uniref:Peptidase S54 rhomboid domain-containing protein n=1 Tax=Neurospora tetrasperma (strain FGSC 2508 / ATCC MYA-4615 / P0657) TaxID=510951 RepID=F8N4V8_NEUT8|nr:uncharacterized protein NEUTE1DRAFT_91388 [Neurospora tetrasperma FGSC 2508]EGO52742.1 hypothetical protein NEUTE1DRAFT_91388 [Neurospora tetrasperma FGSC 2508]